MLDEFDFTIVTINYNNYSGLQKTITSVQRVLCPRVEWVVIDGASTDNSFDLIMKTKGINKFVSEPDKGIYDAMNKGVALANGKYIIFMNSGDTFHWDFDFNLLPVQLDNDSIFYGNCLRHVEKLYYEDVVVNDMPSWWLKGMPCHQSIFLPRKFLLINKFDLSLKMYADAKNVIMAFNTLTNHIQIPTCISIYEVGGISSIGQKNFSAFFIKSKERALAYNHSWRIFSLTCIKGLIKNYLLIFLGFNRYYMASYFLKSFLSASKK